MYVSRSQLHSSEKSASAVRKWLAQFGRKTHYIGPGDSKPAPGNLPNVKTRVCSCAKMRKKLTVCSL